MVRTADQERKWKRIALVFIVLTVILAVNSLSLVQGAFRLDSAHNLPVNYNVDYEIHDYDRDKTYTLRYAVDSDTYNKHRNDYLPKMQIAAGNNDAYSQLVTPDEGIVVEMADHIYEICGPDEEKFANCANQIAHQMYYSLTPQAKSSVQTLVEASGDCDPQAVTVASLLVAADKRHEDFDVDTVLFLYWPDKGSANEEVQWGHMQVGVRIDGGLDDARSDKMDEPSAYQYRGQEYYVLEPTYKRGFSPDWEKGPRLGENWYPRPPDEVIEV